MRRRAILVSGLLTSLAVALPSLAAKAKVVEKTPAEAPAVELKALEQAFFQAAKGLEGVLNGGDHREAPADNEIEKWVKTWTTSKLEFRPMGGKSGDPLDEPGGTRASKGSAGRRGLIEALASVRKAAFERLPRSLPSPKLGVGPTLSAAAPDETPEARERRLSAVRQLVLTYGRRQTDEKGVPLPEITTLPDGNKVALVQTASYSHPFALDWRLTEAGWKLASVEVLPASAIL